jgi:hypothetical protein
MHAWHARAGAPLEHAAQRLAAWRDARPSALASGRAGRLQRRLPRRAPTLLRPLDPQVQHEQPWKRRDLIGVHEQKQEGLHFVGAAVPAGRLLAHDFEELARIAETYGAPLPWLPCARAWPGTIQRPAGFQAPASTRVPWHARAGSHSTQPTRPSSGQPSR